MKFRLPEEERFTIEFTSATDVVFLLLIFFMVATVFIEFPRRLNIELPESKASSLQPQVKSHTLEIDARGQTYLDSNTVTMEELEQTLKKEGGGKSKSSVLIKADRKVDYGRVVEAMGVIKASGISEIGVAVK